MTDDAIVLLVREISTKNALSHDGVNSFKMAMFSFDQNLFNQTCNQFLINKTFRQLFLEVFIPLLNQIGLLWQTNALTIAHEHFISSLITQKIQINIEKVQQNLLSDHGEVVVLFLPEHEIHELGLLYLNYELSLRSKRTIYLGQSMPAENLKMLMSSYERITFVSSFTVSPIPSKLNSYLETMDEMLADTNHSFTVFGFRVKDLDAKAYKSSFNFFPDLESMIASL
jgi:methanogenic corrinoid protein MtbC1